MGANNLFSRSDGQKILAADVNQYRTALNGDLVPRNSSGVPTVDAGGVGTADLPFKRAHVSVGFFFPGMIMPVMDYNGAVTPGQGWMKCNGDIINETNYNAIHGAGAWAEYIASSPLDGKHTPSMNNKFLIGADSTSQDGSSALTYVGNANHVFDNRHNHPFNHYHSWYVATTTGQADRAFSPVDGTSFGIALGASKTGAHAHLVASTSTTDNGPSPVGGSTGNLNTGGASRYDVAPDTTATDNAQSLTQDIKPHSFEVEYWMRII